MPPPTTTITGTAQSRMTGIVSSSFTLVRTADLDALHAGLGFRVGLVDCPTRADDRRGRVERLLVDDRAFLRLHVLYDVILASRKCRRNKRGNHQCGGNGPGIHQMSSSCF